MVHSIIKLTTACTAVALLSACSTWSYSSVNKQNNTAQAAAKTNPASIYITQQDITDRPYTVLGDISATVNKTTIFHSDPTNAMVDEELKEKAADLGADAVILVRYGKGGISMMSWGSLEGKGRAVKFQ